MEKKKHQNSCMVTKIPQGKTCCHVTEIPAAMHKTFEKHTVCAGTTPYLTQNSLWITWYLMPSKLNAQSTVKANVIRVELNHPITGESLIHYSLYVWRGLWKSEVERARIEFQKVEFLSTGQACKAILWPYSTLNLSGFSAEGAFISASMPPYCGV